MAAIEKPTQTSTETAVALAAVGIAALCATVFPLGSRLLMTATGGMYGPFFKRFSPAVFIATSFVVNYLPLVLVAWFLLKYFKVMERVQSEYRGTRPFAIGVVLLGFYIAARVIAATVPGGGAGFVVASFSPFVVVPALVFLAFGAVRLIYGLGKSAV